MKNQILTIVFSVSFLLCFSLSCSDDQITNGKTTFETSVQLQKESFDKEKEEYEKKLKAREDSLSNGIEPLAYLCGTKDVVVWKLEYYLPKSGKELGIATKFASEGEYYSLRNKWGYSNIRISNNTQKTWALNQNFSLNQIMAGVTVNNDGSFTYPSGDFGYYDLDEPFERDEGPYPLSVSQVVNIANNILK